MVQDLFQFIIVINERFPVFSEGNNHKTPDKRLEFECHLVLGLILEHHVGLASRIQMRLLLQTCCLNEVDLVLVKHCVLHILALVVLFCQADELKRFLEETHVEVKHGHSAETVDPAWIQIETMTEPTHCTLIPPEVAIAHG